MSLARGTLEESQTRGRLPVGFIIAIGVVLIALLAGGMSEAIPALAAVIIATLFILAFTE